MNYWLPIILQILALVVGMAEALIPSFGVLAIIALSLLGYSWYFIITNLGPQAIWIFGIANVVLIPLAIKVGFSLAGRSRFAHRSKLSVGSGLEEIHSKYQFLDGKEGVVETPLRPWGNVLVEGEIYEAKSGTGGMIPKGEKIRVVSVAGGRIEVEKLV